MRYFLDIAFSGAEFVGWQRQPNGYSVQQCVEEALATLFRTSIPIVGAGRTDAGVNAYSLPAHADLPEQNVPLEQWRRSLNGILPHSVYIRSIRAVQPLAHARFDATARTYHYYIATECDPFSGPFVLPVRPLPDIDRMNEAAALLLGRHDFTSFSKLHTDTENNFCTLTEAQWQPCTVPNGYCFSVTANRFLRSMVRTLVGTLLMVGNGRIQPDKVRAILESKQRSNAGVSVKPHPLFLHQVTYPDAIYL